MTVPRDENTQSVEMEDDVFLDLVVRLPPDWRRVVKVLLHKVADLEEAEGEKAALTLIEDISSIIATPRTTH